MLNEHESVEVRLRVAHSGGLPPDFDQLDRHLLLGRIVSILLVILSKLERFKELLEEVAFPASLLLFLTVPILLLSIGGESFIVFWLAIPIILFGIAWGGMLFRHRAKETQSFLSIITLPTSPR